jgi:Cu-Zn family superoxide dismutase
VTFTKVKGGVQIIADIDGLTPGKHGFHVHEFGDCGKNGDAAGAHFNPTNQKHGGPDSPERHVGDFGNLEANSHGHAHYERIDKLIQLEGKNSIIGRSIMIHADEDDFTTQPTGASGARIGCGVIEIESE